MKMICNKSLIKVFFLCLAFLFLNGCLSYLWHATANHVKLMTHRIHIQTALERYDFNEDEERKLKMIPEIKDFARKNLGMQIDEAIYTTYIHLDQPYVTYLLRVSKIYELKSYMWYFPVVGSVPYKGFFYKELAEEEAKAFPADEYDTIVRGVSAYSTLGWFEDSVLSSMLSYSEASFVVTVFHELTHTVLFFKSHVNFNERFAEFVGRKAGELFFLKKEGENSETLQKMRDQWEDELLFSFFMEREYKLLDQWYKDNKGKVNLKMKNKRLKELQERFIEQLQPQFKTSRYDYFATIQLNNAILLSYRTYNYRMDEFEKLYALSGYDMRTFIHNCFRFRDDKNPEAALSRFLSQTSSKAKP